MRQSIRNILVALFAVFLSVSANSQDRRTLGTKVADILAQFPAQNAEYTNRLLDEIIGLGSEGIASFCDLIVPPGTGDDTQARYALASLAQYAGSPEQEQNRPLVETALINALEKSSDKEVKAFFIRRLAYCGQSATITALGKYLDTPDLYSPAVSALTSIGTDEAGKTIFSHLEKKTGKQQIEFIKAIGILKFKPAGPYLISLAGQADPPTCRQIYTALAKLGGKTPEKTLKAAAQKAGFSPDETGAMEAWLEYARQTKANGEAKISNSVCNDILKKCQKPGQLRYRSAALSILCSTPGQDPTGLLLKEIRNQDKAYRNAVLRIAGENLTEAQAGQWAKALKDFPDETQAELLYFLAPRQEKTVLDEAIIPSLSSTDKQVREEAARALAVNQHEKAVPELLNQLQKVQDDEEYDVLEQALQTACSVKECDLLASRLGNLSDKGKAIAVRIMAAKRATSDYSRIAALCSSPDPQIRQAAFDALSRLARPKDIADLIILLKKTNDPKETEAVQQAIITLYLDEDHPSPSIILNEMNAGTQKEKLIPVLPYLNDRNALKTVTSIMKTGQQEEKKAAFKALTNWNDASALPVLSGVFQSGELRDMREKALGAYLEQALKPGIPADQQLLWLEKIMTECTSVPEKSQVIEAAGSVKTFLSLIFVAPYLEQDELSDVAAQSAMEIALPSAGEKNGLTGEIVRQTLVKVKNKISGPDSQYFKIDIQEYLDKMPEEQGYTSIFNGKDLTGWQGLVKNPIERAKMTPKELAREQEAANKRMKENWSVQDGCIVFNGNGDNLCSQKIYKDFDLLVDWKITKNGDSGIYLRGTPQVQIWDTARVDVGAQVGSGGLYNNQNNPDEPLVLADNAIGDWNTFRIRMVGPRVTVYLNGKLVVDNVILENYWDRSLPIFSEGPIELQAHGTNLAFRNLYVREINPDNSSLSGNEKAEGFVSLFNGHDLDNWVGNKVDYVAEDGEIAVLPKEGSHGNLYTANEYSNFILRFEFQLTPGANNGLGVHAPLEGDAAYVGKEIQILDNTASVYANLQTYQYHGSVYGVIPAKRGFLKPVGQWNEEEVTVKGDNFKVVLNGEVILDGNVKEASVNGTADHKEHPGLERHTGHIGFLGHGSELRFRNIRIKELD